MSLQKHSESVFRALAVADARTRFFLAAAAAGLVLAVGLTLGSFYETQSNRQFQQSVRSSAQSDLANVRSGVEIALNAKTSLTQGLRAHVATNPDISQLQFEEFSRQLIEDTPGVRSLTLLRDSVISNVHPMAGNESAIGFAPLDDPNQRDAIQAAIDSPKGKLTGPVQLRQSGQAFIDRVPVFLPSSDASSENTDRGNYWGLVSILFDHGQVVKEIRSCLPLHIDVAICCEETGSTKPQSGGVFFGRPELLRQDPLTATVALPTATWRLYGVPVGGWPTERKDAWVRRLAWAAASSILALLAFTLVHNSMAYLNSVAEMEASNRKSQRVQQILAKTSRMAKVGGWEYDLDRQELIWSDEICLIHDRPPGYKPKLEEAIQYYSPSGRAQVSQAVEACVERFETFEYELPLTTATGREIWVRALGEPELVDGRCVRIWGTFQDVTELHEANRQLQLTQYAVDHSADIVLFIDEAGRITYTNQQAEAALDFAAHSLQPPNAFDLVPEISRANWPSKWQALKQQGYDNYTTLLQRRQREPLVCDVTMWYVGYEGAELVVATARDVTEARREAELRNVLFERSTDAHLLFDESGIIECNQAAVEMLRMDSKAELLHSHPAIFSPELQPDGQASAEKCIEMDALAHQNGSHRFDWIHQRANGESFPCEVTLNPVQLKSGPAILVVWHDISERKKAEANLATSNLELQQFAYVASHDLQAPLRGIANFAQFLEEDYADKLDADARDYITRIVGGCKRMQTLINDLLSYSHVDGRSRPLKAVNLQDVCNEVLEVLHPTIEESNAQVIVGNLPNVTGDHSQLVQLLMNLIGNAIKYNNSEVPAVHVEFDDSEGVFTVRDNGIGIAPQHQKKVFEIFRRLHSQDEYPGTGIGLAICRRIVEHHGGKLHLQSTEGEGCKFTFSLTLCTETETPKNSIENWEPEPSCQD